MSGPQALSSLLSRIALAGVALLMPTACDECDAEPLANIPVPQDQIDLFSQKQAAQVDILWVVDNSGSMAAEQAKIADRFSDFFRQLIVSQVDYHIGVITTDPAEEGSLRAYDGPGVAGCEGCRFITKAVACPNPDVQTAGLNPTEVEQQLLSSCPAQLVFRRLVNVGTEGTAFEEGFPQAARALGAASINPSSGFPAGDVPAANEGFLRDGASLYIVFVSDEDEGAKQDGSPVRYYQRLFEGIKRAGNENLVSVSAITGWPREEGTPPVAELCAILATTYDGDATNDDPRAAQVRELIASGDTGCIDESGVQGDPNSYAETGGRYIELACRTGGVVSNMCEADYSAALDQLGANAAGLLRKFVISKPGEMDRGTDCVLGTASEPGDDPILDCDGDGASIVGDDEVEFDGPLCVSARAIGSEPGSESLIVRDANRGWEWEESTRSVRFNGNFVPAPGSEVSIRYKLRVAGAPSCN